MKLAPLALLFSLTATTFAQTTFTDPANLRGERVAPSDGHEIPVQQGALGLQQLLRRINTRASILNIVAHPDDEDGGMLTFYSRGMGARVADLALTRGEGGQNAVTGDFEDALGLLRTQELLANDRYTGVEQMFGTEVDFGFSKTKEEAFAKWTHRRVLYDAVRAIRLYRPLVITATFVGGVTDGHGQHQVSGEIAQEAFKAAADPKVFPEMIAEGILPWQALKVYARVPMGAITGKGLFDYATNQYTPARFTNYVTGAVTTTVPSVDVVVHEGNTDPLLTRAAANIADLPPALASAAPTTPLSYVQFARIGLGLQRSQIGPGVRNAPSGTFDVSYHLYGSVVNADKAVSADHASFFDGIDTSLESIATLAPGAFPPDSLSNVSRAIRTAQEKFDPTHPGTIAPTLATALQNMDQVITQVDHWNGDATSKASALHELRIKHVQLNDALVLALGLKLTAESPIANVVVKQTVSATAHLSQTSDEHIVFRRLMSANSAGEGIAEGGGDVQEGEEPHLTKDHSIVTDCGLDPGHATEPTRPYFFRDSIEAPVYQLLDPSLRNAPATPNALTCFTDVMYNGVRLELGAVARHITQPVSFIPLFSIAASPRATVFPLGQEKADLTAILRTTSTTPANINVQSPHNWTIQARAAVSASTPTEHPIDFFIHPTAPFSQPQLFQVVAQTPDHQSYTEGFRSVGYPGLIATNYYTPATTRVVPVNLKLPEHHRIGYLPGTGDAVPQALASIGLTPTILTVADLNPANLVQYDTVILGVRTYDAHRDLHGVPTHALLDYARNGGNVLVQYQTGEFTAADAPFPLELGNAEKVVDETDPVELLSPNATLLTTPNHITPADFNGWIEERGHGFLASWDTHYTALTETHDPGGPETAAQLPQRGGLITTPLGKGHWTYCAFALYRQLPEAVPGAFRIFVNLVAP
jgi:LmbE family N-acetylglucosaminyl deacetylase